MQALQKLQEIQELKGLQERSNNVRTCTADLGMQQ